MANVDTANLNVALNAHGWSGPANDDGTIRRDRSYGWEPPLGLTRLLRWMVALAAMVALSACGGSSVTSPDSSPPPVASATTVTRANTPSPTPPAGAEQATVTRVVDGDTIDVRRADGSIARVRY